MDQQLAETAASKVAAARLSVLSNTCITVVKLVVGVATGSISVLSEAAHSANDLVAAGLAFFAVRMSDRPADDRHPYGHGKIENISGFLEAGLILLAAAYIVYEAVHRLIRGSEHLIVWPGIIAMLVSALTNILVSRRLFKVAAETDSMALKADAEHLRTDVLTSLGVVAGLAAVYITGWYVLDPIVAIAVALLIVRAAVRLLNEALHGLMDASLPEADLAHVRAVLDAEPAVLAYHKLRARKTGSSRHIDAHVLVSDDLTLLEAHRLTEDLEDRIRQRIPRADVTLHTEPHDAEMQHQEEHHAGGDRSS